MLNLNLSLLTLTFFIFYSSRTTLSFSNIQWSLFVVALSSFPKASAKVLPFSLPTKFFSNYFSKNFHFFCNYPRNQANIFSSFFVIFLMIFRSCYFGELLEEIFFLELGASFFIIYNYRSIFILYYLPFSLFYPHNFAFY